MSVIETLSLGTDKRIHLVKAGEQYILIATSSKDIEFLTNVSINDMEKPDEEDTKNKAVNFDFKALFDKYLTSYKNKKSDTVKSDMSMLKNEDDKFRLNLYKLKDITHKINTQSKKDGVDFTDEK